MMQESNRIELKRELTGMKLMTPQKLKFVMPVSLASILSRKRARRQTIRCASFTLLDSLEKEVV
jgi:hypothetical protein